MQDCIFCRIVRNEIPSSRVYEDEKVLAFDDIHPVAPVHVILIPKEHIPTLMDVGQEHMPIMAAMINAIQEVACRKGVDERGFRTVINCKSEGGQVILHLHVHIIGGRRLQDGMG
ncbi:MAG: histidine triad nucleotide-binding protein [Syntrophales bacterium]|nr:histidine triad nucleotide-binding protein [Syntrophales bacterium]